MMPHELTSIISRSLCNAFRRFIPNFARIPNQHNYKLRENKPKSVEYLTEEEKEVLTTLR